MGFTIPLGIDEIRKPKDDRFLVNFNEIFELSRNYRKILYKENFLKNIKPTFNRSVRFDNDVDCGCNCDYKFRTFPSWIIDEKEKKISNQLLNISTKQKFRTKWSMELNPLSVHIYNYVLLMLILTTIEGVFSIDRYLILKDNKELISGVVSRYQDSPNFIRNIKRKIPLLDNVFIDLYKMGYVLNWLDNEKIVNNMIGDSDCSGLVDYVIRYDILDKTSASSMKCVICDVWINNKLYNHIKIGDFTFVINEPITNNRMHKCCVNSMISPAIQKYNRSRDSRDSRISCVLWLVDSPRHDFRKFDYERTVRLFCNVLNHDNVKVYDHGKVVIFNSYGKLEMLQSIFDIYSKLFCGKVQSYYHVYQEYEHTHIHIMSNVNNRVSGVPSDISSLSQSVFHDVVRISRMMVDANKDGVIHSNNMFDLPLPLDLRHGDDLIMSYYLIYMQCFHKVHDFMLHLQYDIPSYNLLISNFNSDLELKDEITSFCSNNVILIDDRILRVYEKSDIIIPNKELIKQFHFTSFDLANERSKCVKDNGGVIELNGYDDHYNYSELLLDLQQSYLSTPSNDINMISLNMVYYSNPLSKKDCLTDVYLVVSETPSNPNSGRIHNVKFNYNWYSNIKKEASQRIVMPLHLYFEVMSIIRYLVQYSDKVYVQLHETFIDYNLVYICCDGFDFSDFIEPDQDVEYALRTYNIGDEFALTCKIHEWVSTARSLYKYRNNNKVMPDLKSLDVRVDVKSKSLESRHKNLVKSVIINEFNNGNRVVDIPQYKSNIGKYKMMNKGVFVNWDNDSYILCERVISRIRRKNFTPLLRSMAEWQEIKNETNVMPYLTSNTPGECTTWFIFNLFDSIRHISSINRIAHNIYDCCNIGDIIVITYMDYNLTKSNKKIHYVLDGSDLLISGMGGSTIKVLDRGNIFNLVYEFDKLFTLILNTNSYEYLTEQRIKDNIFISQQIYGINPNWEDYDVDNLTKNISLSNKVIVYRRD